MEIVNWRHTVSAIFPEKSTQPKAVYEHAGDNQLRMFGFSFVAICTAETQSIRWTKNEIEYFDRYPRSNLRRIRL